MKPFSCLAIDMGAGSIRVVQGVFNKQLELREIHRFENEYEQIDGHLRWNLDKITSGIDIGIKKAYANSDIPILSIGVDSWGVDFVLIGKDGLPLENPVSYRDTRTKGMQEQWNQTLSDFETFKRTGINYNIFNSLYQFESIKNTAVLKRTSRVLFMSDYINYYLSGKMANELTLANTSQLLNIETSNWDPLIIKELGLTNILTNQPVSSGTKLGTLKQFKAPSTEVIAVAGHDTASAVAALNTNQQNAAFISTGTWCIVGIFSDKPLLSEQAYKFGVTNEMTHEGKFRPLKNLMGLWLIQQLKAAFGNIHSYEQIDQIATALQASTYLIDPSDKLFYNPENMKIAFDQYLSNKYGIVFENEAQYYRCAFDSLANSFMESLSVFEKISGNTIDIVHITGGGAKSELLCQLTANTTQKIVKAGPVEGAVTGNLMIQALSLKKFKSQPEADSYFTKSMKVKTYNPF
ncbi:MAG TPA: FGGY family carbohydrate kinase [Prolixibacteraceae bacterium]|nr:FGGY family carbohydrate kinase [Prolixibacteraceae bacterium]